MNCFFLIFRQLFVELLFYQFVGLVLAELLFPLVWLVHTSWTIVSSCLKTKHWLNFFHPIWKTFTWECSVRRISWTFFSSFFEGLLRAGLLQQFKWVPVCWAAGLLCGGGGPWLYHSQWPECHLRWEWLPREVPARTGVQSIQESQWVSRESRETVKTLTCVRIQRFFYLANNLDLNLQQNL